MAHSPETKAAVVAALLTGQGIDKVAEEYNIPRGTVGRWAAELRADGRNIVDAKKERISELLQEYLAEGLTTLNEQHKAFRDPAWLQKQDANAVAVLHGVITDKIVRLLEALAPDGDGADQ